ncbi:hypothetical protein BGZ90_001849, partial [Linnemannia elongata]
RRPRRRLLPLLPISPSRLRPRPVPGPLVRLPPPPLVTGPLRRLPLTGLLPPPPTRGLL